jgi:FkbM family methyltransferase
MFKKVLASLIKKNPQNITEKEIYAVYEHLLGRAPNTDETTHWITVRATTNRISNELQQSYELWQKNIYQFRVLVTLTEFKIYAMQNDLSIGASIIYSKSFESHVGNAIKKSLKPGDVFLDLGANIGFFSLLAASIVQDTGKVISVEPNMQNLQLLYASILENHFTNINILPFAASDCFQILNLTSFGSNGLVGIPQTNQSNSQFVQSVAIDELLQNERKISLVKLDIEGYEPLALKGIENILIKHNPIIISEFSPWHIVHRTQIAPKDYLRQLTQHDYSLNILEPSGDTIFNKDIDFIMDYWTRLNDDKQHLDLIAHKNTN